MSASFIDSWPLFSATLVVHFILYFVLPIFLFVWRRPFAAGVTMLLSTVLPIAAQTMFTDSEAPGFGILLMLEFPVAAAVFVIGKTMSIIARVRQYRDRTRLRSTEHL